ncbi:NUDIX hydrolase [Loigolactobacillus coryniformis]|uniref:NUDIX hydrolase n=1 Tax=Loigolactobacillus coryniformis TaxID=1610 RepID=UPI00233FF8A4|nr:NUDIX hydrolase [Loigolactobacillus coryniformis]MDC4186068.1 NUDIX hydrolase [Loigolactobacillus coryniformis]
MEFAEKRLTNQRLYHGAVIDLDLETVALPNGKTAKREIVRHPGAAAIMALTVDQRMIFVEQWREPLQQVTLEVPAGKIDARDVDAEAAAWRELNEEAGYTADKLTLQARFYSSPGFADERMSLYLATDIQPVTKRLALDDDEFLRLHLLTLAQAQEQIEAGVICDAKTLIAVQYWQAMS